MSPEDQNSGPTKRTYVLQTLFKVNYQFVITSSSELYYKVKVMGIVYILSAQNVIKEAPFLSMIKGNKNAKRQIHSCE